jgi:hypothetical protein
MSLRLTLRNDKAPYPFPLPPGEREGCTQGVPLREASTSPSGQREGYGRKLIADGYFQSR